ncbi:hypothetical protein AAFC00_001741 [Neodothiora populina]|uniref:P/Homo B domain-containing protein n=1 Tax=Neodothiora populina TaxID=2781224 RepID=A0ABR3PPZ8_9PEZI
MRSPLNILFLAATCAAAIARTDYDSNDYYAVHLAPSVDPSAVAAHFGLQLHGAIGQLEDHYLLEAPKGDHDIIKQAKDDLKRLRRKRQRGWNVPHLLDDVLLNQKQERRQRLSKRGVAPLTRAEEEPPVDSNVQKGKDIAKSLNIVDPIFMDQWHLYNAAQPGHDINVTGVWQQGITGKNSTVCIVDDGLDMDSDDLRDNYFAAGSYDFNDQVEDPKPRLSDDRHGTRCAGEVAAGRNDVCGVGVAYDSKISGLRILSALISDADEAVAMTYAYQDNHIYSCSWGPPDDGRSMEGPGILIRRAMVTGVQKGRGGLGSVYVFAIGNGANNDDNCNFDGYTNSIYSVSVGGIDRKGLHPYYSEKCSAQLVVTYSSGSGDAIHTTDVGQNKCYENHGGTSAAGPLVAGIYALVLEVRDDLSWRDFQWLTVMTAAPVDQESDWQDTTTGRRFSHQFGYGKIDAYAIVEAAKTWKPVKPQAWFFSPWLHVRHDVPQGDKGLASHFNVTKEMMQKANLERLEHVTVTMNVEHTRRGDLSVELRSPSGIVSHIATSRKNDAAESGYVDWTFMSVAHWGEDGIGTWTVIVKDTVQNEHSGRFTDWRLKFWGEAEDAAKQKLLPLPTESEDDDHDVETTSAVVGTTSVDVPTHTGTPVGNPTDHIDRPVNSKTSATATGTTAATSKPSSTSVAEEPVDEAKPTASSSPEPSIFPTFGVSKRTRIWIYGALALISIFCVSLSVWYYLARRRRQRDARDEYEFEMLNDEEIDDDSTPNGANGSGLSAKAKGKRRAGELYDAFAEGSDDEDDVFSIGDEDDHVGVYRDEADDHVHHEDR